MQVKTIKIWHKEVCKDGKCKVCKKSFPDDMRCGHHIKSKGSRPDLKLETNNGLCVCFKCHLRIHDGTIKLNNNERP